MGSVLVTLHLSAVRISAEIFGEFMRTHYPIAVRLFQGVPIDQGSVHQIIGYRQWIEVAGAISVRPMHGSNIPTNANARVTSQLRPRSVRDRYGRLPPAAMSIYGMLGSQSAADVASAAVSSPPMPPMPPRARGSMRPMRIRRKPGAVTLRAIDHETHNPLCEHNQTGGAESGRNPLVLGTRWAA